MISENPLKVDALTSRRLNGVHLTFTSHSIIEILLQTTKLDYLYLDGEHGHFDWHDVEISCVVAERYGVTTIARVPDRTAPTITRFLDCGVRGIVAPHIDSVDDAKQVLDAVYFAPLGSRSYGAGRPDYGLNIANRTAHMASCNRNVSVGIMIESTAGLAHAADIATLQGVDYLSFGLNDLAQSMGHPGEPEHQQVKLAVDETSARIRSAGGRVREDFLNFAWIKDVLTTGVKQLFP